MLVSIVLGTILARCRNYEKHLFGRIASVYIEVFRSTPWLRWILIGVFMLPLALFRAGFGLTLYTYGRDCTRGPQFHKC
ncbi:MAG: hypothetical protein LBT14_00410 [Treponema sp.]|nr:hypothetical protein [Treponema sp.]